MKHHNKPLANFLIKLFPFLLISAISAAVLNKVLFADGSIMYGDLVFPFPVERYLSFHGYPMWNPYGSHSATTGAPLLPFLAPATAIASMLHMPMESVAKAQILGSLILIGLSMYYATNALLKEYGTGKIIAFIASIIAALVYMFNTWSLNRVSHIWFWGVSYALTPLLLVCFMKTLKGRKMTYVIATALLWCIASATPAYAIFDGVLILSWLAFSILCSPKTLGRSVLSFTRATLLVSVFYLAFSAFWILPYIITSFQTGYMTGYILTDENLNFFSRNSSLLNVIRLMGYWIIGIEIDYQPSSQALYYPWLFASFVLPLFAFASLLLNPKNKHSLYFLLMGLLFIFLAKGAQSPFPSSYAFLVFHVTEIIGLMFRDPNKWEGLLALAYCFLISSIIAEILKMGWEKRSSITKKLILAVVLGIFISSFALFVKPGVNRWFGEIYVPLKVPDYHTINNWLADQSGDFKVSWLPEYRGRDTTWGSRITGSVCSFDIWSSSKPSLGTVAGVTPLTTYYYQYIYSESLLNSNTAYFGKYLDPVNIRYVVFHDDIVGAEKEANAAIANFKKQMDLKFVKQEGFYYVFENEGYASHIFVPSQTLLVSGGLKMLTSLNAIEEFDPNSFSILYLDQTNLNDYPNAEGIVLASKSNLNDVALAQVDDQYLIAPFAHTTRLNPGEAWSRADLGTWNWFLKSFFPSSNPWEFDYGRGVVMTYDFRHGDVSPCLIATGDVDLWEKGCWTEHDHISMKSEEDSLVIDYTFDDENSVQVHFWTEIEQENWENYDTLTLSVYGDGSGNDLQFWYMMEGSSWGIESISLDWVGWKKLSFTFPKGQPRYEVSQFKIVVDWSVYKSQEGLDSHKIKVKDITLSSESQSLPRHTLTIPIEIQREGQRELYALVLENPWGGELTIFIDGQKVSTVTTEARTSNFVWINIGTVTLSRGRHSITLENSFGFNALNVLALIPQEAAEGYFDSAHHFLEGRRIIHILSRGESIHILRDSPYKIGVRALTGPRYKPMVLELDDKMVKINLTDKEEKLKWVYSEPMFLQKGEHDLRILSKGETEIDSVIVFSTNGDETLSDIFRSKKSPVDISWKETDPTKYIVNINTENPFMLAFVESYDPLWVAKVNGKEYKSLPLYSVINGFYIDDAGELEITIEYEPQRWFYYGTGISVASLITALAYFAWNWRLKRWRACLKAK